MVQREHERLVSNTRNNKTLLFLPLNGFVWTIEICFRNSCGLASTCVRYFRHITAATTAGIAAAAAAAAQSKITPLKSPGTAIALFGLCIPVYHSCSRVKQHSSSDDTVVRVPSAEADIILRTLAVTQSARVCVPLLRLRFRFASTHYTAVSRGRCLCEGETSIL